MKWLFVVLFVLLGAALLFVFKNRERDEEKAKFAITGILAAVVVLIILQIFVGGRSSAPQVTYDPTLDEGIAETAAREIAQVANGGRVVILSEMGPPNRPSSARLRGFTRGIEAAGLELLGTSDATVGVESEDGLLIAEEGVAPGAIERALEEHPDVEVLVSLAGLPPLEPNELPAAFRRIEFFAVEEHPWVDWEALLASGLLSGLVMSPVDVDWQDTSGTPEEVYHRRYLLVTGQNLQDVRSRFTYHY